MSWSSLELKISFLNNLIPKASVSTTLQTDQSSPQPTPCVAFLVFVGTALFTSVSFSIYNPSGPRSKTSWTGSPLVTGPTNTYILTVLTLCENAVLHPKVVGVCDETPSVVTAVSQLETNPQANGKCCLCRTATKNILKSPFIVAKNKAFVSFFELNMEVPGRLRLDNPKRKV